MLENTRGNDARKFSLNNGLRKKKEERKKKREVRIRFGSKLKNIQAEKRTRNHEKKFPPHLPQTGHSPEMKNFPSTLFDKKIEFQH